MYESIVSYFETQWANRTPVVYENKSYSPSTRASWIRFRVFDGLKIPASIGSNMAYRTNGYVNVLINVPEDSGTKIAKLLADEIIKIFVARQIGSVTFRNIEKHDLGVWDSFYQISVNIYFWGDEFVSDLRA